nr:pectinesterase inhibitor 10-like [Arachis hypogaea]
MNNIRPIQIQTTDGYSKTVFGREKRKGLSLYQHQVSFTNPKSLIATSHHTQSVSQFLSPSHPRTGHSPSSPSHLSSIAVAELRSSIAVAQLATSTVAPLLHRRRPAPHLHRRRPALHLHCRRRALHLHRRASPPSPSPSSPPPPSSPSSSPPLSSPSSPPPPSSSVLVALQAALTVIGNFTMCIAAYRIYKSSSEGSKNF